MQQKAKLLLLSASLSLLAACSTSSQDISLIPTQTDAITQKKGAFTQPLKWSGHRPDCQGTCPYVEIDSLIFPGKKPLTELVDQSLAALISSLDSDRIQPDVESFIEYFWQTAAPADEAYLAAKTIYRNPDLTTIELGAWHYHTGAAHGMSTTRFINWSHKDQKALVLDDLLQPGKREQFFAVQKQAHQKWLAKLDFAQDDPEQYLRLWPFQPTDNVAITDAGLLIKYDPYAIAPYAAGMPQILLPYSELQDVLRPQYMPDRSGKKL